MMDLQLVWHLKLALTAYIWSVIDPSRRDIVHSVRF